jgi:hypothetical protein
MIIDQDSPINEAAKHRNLHGTPPAGIKELVSRI